MRINQVEIYKSPIKLKEPFIISLGKMEYAENVIVIIRTDSGFTGYGECSPFLTINGESMDTCFIVGQYLAKGIMGLNPVHLETCSFAMDKIIHANHSIKSAFDIALHDIAAQHAGLPLYAFLGGKNDKQLITDYTVSIGDKDKMAADAQSIVERGFQVIKVKLGEVKDKDIERIKTIREKIGNTLPIRIDANQGWGVYEAIEILQKLEPFNIQFCEEPIPRWNYMALSAIRNEVNIPIMADECCMDHRDAERLIQLNACDMFNVKLGKSAGLFKAKKIIQMAASGGMKMQMGGFLESRLGFTAAAHMALLDESVAYYDFDTPLMFVEDPINGGISYGSNGLVAVPDIPGLGAWVDEQYLQRMEKVIVSAECCCELKTV